MAKSKEANGERKKERCNWQKTKGATEKNEVEMRKASQMSKVKVAGRRQNSKGKKQEAEGRRKK